jgi:hypothetical protein
LIQHFGTLAELFCKQVGNPCPSVWYSIID